MIFPGPFQLAFVKSLVQETLLKLVYSPQTGQALNNSKEVSGELDSYCTVVHFFTDFPDLDCTVVHFSFITPRLILCRGSLFTYFPWIFQS